MFIFVCVLLFVNSEVPSSAPSNLLNSHDSEIAAVLYYLNSSNFKVYNYKEATLLNAQIKADITELLLDVNVECVNNYPEIPCTAKTLTCHAFVRNSNERSQVLNDVNCKPKPEIIVEEQNLDDQSEAEIQPKSIVLSNEAVSSEINEPFVAVRHDMAPCLGCPFDLNPNAEGVDELIDLALEHITSERLHKQALIRVVKLQQQVVAGVKFILVAEIAPTTCVKDSNLQTCPVDINSDTAICQIVYLQKPWISRTKHVISNNCTNSQEFVKNNGKKTEISNEINLNRKIGRSGTTNFDEIAESGVIEEISSGRLADIESQILTDVENLEVNQTSSVNSEVSDLKSTQEPTAETVENFSTEDIKNKKASEDIFEFLEATTSQTDIDFERNLETTTPLTRERRAIPQLEKISQDEKPLVKNLADFAASAADNIDDDNYKRVVLQILGAKKMPADKGIYYHLIMRMGVSKCLEDKPNYENCREKLFENYTKICKVQIYVNDDFVVGPKVVKSQCQNIKKDKNDNNRTNYSRFKRKIGGQNEIDKKDEKIRNLFKDGIIQLNAQRNTNKYKPFEVTSATSQVVAGIIYRLKVKIIETDCESNSLKDLDECNIRENTNPKKCEVKIWEKKWQNFRQYSIKCEDDDQYYKIESKITRRKRDVFVGGQTTVDKNSPEIQQYLKEGIQHLNSQRNLNKHKPVEVISATTQVVAGFLFRIRTKIAESDCPKDSSKSLDDCKILENATPRECVIKIWEKSWENFKQFTIKCDGDDQEYKVNAKTNRKKRGIPGGETAIDKNSPEVQQYLNEGINHLNSQRNLNKHKPVEVISATTQVVAGSLVRIRTKIAESDCPKDSSKSLDDCKLLENATPKECLIKIWEKSWENFKQFTIKCDGDNQEYTIDAKIKRNKRSLAGGETKIDKNSPKIKQYLNDGINHLNSQRNLNRHKPVEVISATTQVVAGSLVRIKTKIAESDCTKDSQKSLNDCKVLENATPKECLIKIWEKPWQNFKEFTITCDGDKQEYKIQTKINESRKKRSVGVKFDTTDNYVNNYLLAGLQQLEKQHNKKFKVLKVLEATKQIVGGHIYRIKAQIIDTNCKSIEDLSINNCDILQDSQPQICNFKIFEALWTPNSRQINISCDNYKSKHTLTFSLFKNFIKKFNKTYSKKEFKYRLKIFSDNLDKIEELNKNEQGTAIYGITKFCDLSPDEFSKFLGYKPELRDVNQEPFPQAEIPDIHLPVEFDWRKKGAVTEVKNQGQCGSCWAFSVTGNVEGQYAIKYNKLLEFSEQELVDCDKEDQGCNGGLMDTAYRQIMKLGGLETEQDYPYDAEDEKCHFNQSSIEVQLSGAVNVSQDENEMAKFLVANGPISIAINANAMQFYFGGVSHPLKFLCNPKNLDHGVLIVGYGVHTYPLFNRTLPYWTVKNSWGPNWGEQGYYRVYRGDGTCGLNQTPSSAIVV